MKSEFTIRELSAFLNISVDNIRLRAGRLRLPKRYRTYRGKVKERYFYSEEIDLIKGKLTQAIMPEIIYVTRTTEIYQSKMNFLTLEQL